MSEEIEELIEPQYARNIDIKIEARRERVFWLWLRGYKLREIEEMTGVERTTLWRDIKAVREQLAANPQTIEQILMETLMMMRFIRADALEMARKADLKNAHRYYKVAADIDKKILERFTQPETMFKVEDHSDDEKAKAVIDFIIEKMGPEALDGFETWYQNRLEMNKISRFNSTFANFKDTI